MKKLITIDFDDTLCFDNDIDKPNQKLIDYIFRMKEKDYRFLIVTARNREYNNLYAKTDIYDFLEKYNLPITKVVYTNGNLKGNTLKDLKSVLHIDNDLEQIDSCKKAGVKTFYIKNPSKKKWENF